MPASPSPGSRIWATRLLEHTTPFQVHVEVVLLQCSFVPRGSNTFRNVVRALVSAAKSWAVAMAIKQRSTVKVAAIGSWFLLVISNYTSDLTRQGMRSEREILHHLENFENSPSCSICFQVSEVESSSFRFFDIRPACETPRDLQPFQTQPCASTRKNSYISTEMRPSKPAATRLSTKQNRGFILWFVSSASVRIKYTARSLQRPQTLHEGLILLEELGASLPSL